MKQIYEFGYYLNYLSSISQFMIYAFYDAYEKGLSFQINVSALHGWMKFHIFGNLIRAHVCASATFCTKFRLLQHHTASYNLSPTYFFPIPHVQSPPDFLVNM